MFDSHYLTHKLEDLLELILKELQEKNLINVNDQDKEALINQVKDHIENANGGIPDLKLNRENLPQLVKALSFMLVSEHVNQTNPAFNLKYAQLLKELDPEQKEQLKQELINALTAQLMKLKQNLNQPANPAEVKAFATELVNSMINEKENMLALDEEASNTFIAAFILLPSLDAKMLDHAEQQIRALNGGMDTREAGGERYPIVEVLGNIGGFLNASDGQGDSFMADQQRYDGHEDYMGDEAGVFFNLVSIGANLSESVLNQFNPNSPRPEPK